MLSIEELQAQLAEKIASLDTERKENAKLAKEERERMILDIEIERKQRQEAYEAKVAEHEKNQRDREASVEAKRQAEIAERMVTEQKQSALDENLRLQREKLEWLEKTIADAEFSEEQHRNSLKNMLILPVTVVEGTEVSKEYPQTCAEGGASASGTEGSTPENPLMSTHLKQILRQTTRQY